jgi:hypothetical protein
MPDIDEKVIKAWAREIMPVVRDFASRADEINKATDAELISMLEGSLRLAWPTLERRIDTYLDRGADAILDIAADMISAIPVLSGVRAAQLLRKLKAEKVP